jgi:hypothetical protein
VSYYAFSAFPSSFPRPAPDCSKAPYCGEARILQPYDLTRAYGESPEECEQGNQLYDPNTDSCYTEVRGNEPVWGSEPEVTCPPGWTRQMAPSGQYCFQSSGASTSSPGSGGTAAVGALLLLLLAL